VAAAGVGLRPGEDAALRPARPRWRPGARRGRGADAAPLLRAYLANLALNAGWTWLFFRTRRPALATAEAALLAASTADLARRSWALDRPAGAALVPYAAWTSFAAALTAAIARRNPR
jgi:tryptophan-rich sensory protein